MRRLSSIENVKDEIKRVTDEVSKLLHNSPIANLTESEENFKSFVESFPREVLENVKKQFLIEKRKLQTCLNEVYDLEGAINEVGSSLTSLRKKENLIDRKLSDLELSGSKSVDMESKYLKYKDLPNGVRALSSSIDAVKSEQDLKNLNLFNKIKFVIEKNNTLSGKLDSIYKQVVSKLRLISKLKGSIWWEKPGVLEYWLSTFQQLKSVDTKSQILSKIIDIFNSYKSPVRESKSKTNKRFANELRLESLEVNRNRLLQELDSLKERIKPLFEEVKLLREELKRIDDEIAEEKTKIELKKYDLGFKYSHQTNRRLASREDTLEWNRAEIGKLKADRKAISDSIRRKQIQRNKLADEIGNLTSQKEEIQEKLRQCYLKLDEIGNKLK